MIPLPGAEVRRDVVMLGPAELIPQRLRRLMVLRFIARQLALL